MVQAVSPTSIVFNVQRGKTELVTPAKPTPYEFKPLSDFDWFRTHVSIIWFYPHNPSMDGVDPAKLIRNAISETLVFYYPLAGRLREDSKGKLIVECTGEGILFIEADADVTLDQFGYPLVPPYPCLDQLIYEEPDSSDILNSPLVLIQVTRLKCGGFIFGVRMNHTMCDAAGEAQFLSAIGEMARGATSPSVLPVWERNVLKSTNPRPPEKNHHHGSEADNTNNSDFPLDLCYKTFIFRPIEILVLRRCLPLHLHHSSTFQVITAAIWKCRVAAVQPDPSAKETTSLIWAINLRSKNKVVPSGYYGNAIGYSISTSTVKEILKNPLCYAVQLIRNGEEQVYTDPLNRDPSIKDSAYSLSDARNAGLDDVDFGWGKALCGSPVVCMPSYGWYQKLFKRNKRELDGIMLPFCLPKHQMEIFEMELNNMLKEQPFTNDENVITSKL